MPGPPTFLEEERRGAELPSYRHAREPAQRRPAGQQSQEKELLVPVS